MTATLLTLPVIPTIYAWIVKRFPNAPAELEPVSTEEVNLVRCSRL